MKPLNEVCIKLGKFLRKHSSLILTIGASAGVIGTAIVSTRQGSILEQKRTEAEAKHEDIKASEVVKTVSPTIFVTTATLACIIGLYVTDQKKQAGLAAAVGVVSERFARFKKKVEEKDEELAKSIDKEIMQEEYMRANKPNKKKELLKTIDGKEIFVTEIHEGEPMLCYDPVSEKYFYSSKEDLMQERYEINRHLLLQDTLSANEYLAFLGLPEVEWGWNIGWSTYAESDYGYKWIDIGIEEYELSDDLTILKLHVPFMPHDMDPDYDWLNCDYYNVR